MNSVPETARIIAIGDELLEGRTSDTNSRRIQRALAELAVGFAGIEVVPDRPEAIIEALDRTGPTDLVFVSGGLGSTPDDITRETVARWAGVDLVEDPRLKERIENRWRDRGIRSRSGAGAQCLVPVEMSPVDNPVGSAPALVGRLKGRVVVLLPGVPQEMQGLLPPVVDHLTARNWLPAGRRGLLWRTAQAAELALVRRCESILTEYGDLDWSWWMTEWGVDVRVFADECAELSGRLKALQAAMDSVLGKLVYSRRMVSLPHAIQVRCLAAEKTLAVAESCTGGLIGGAVTAEAGSSGYFLGGFQVYADRAKQQLLEIPAPLLAEHGAVSEPVVRAMAAGCRRALGADFGLAVSGISGPGGGTVDKPVGTTWVAVADDRMVHSRCYRFPGDRERNRLLTVAAALDSLRRVLEFPDAESPWAGTDDWCRP